MLFVTISPAKMSPANISSVFIARNIIIIVAVMFLICGILHFVIRFLIKKKKLSSNSHSQSSRFQENSIGDATVYQRQLQQLFNLQDSGLEQASIDALPMFTYKDLVGLKDQLHCAVCLCEFTKQDSLRLLPVCSHAFHSLCIDTWLVTNSTCPLCRGNLFTPGFSIVNPVFDFDFDFDLDQSREEQEEDCDHGVSGNFKQSERVYSVRLGKFKAINGETEEVGETSNINLDERRCYSMGSYEYVVGNSDLKVALWNNVGCSMRGSIGNSVVRIDEGRNGKEISNGSKGESFSVSKIWLWSKKDDKFQDSSIHICSNPISM